MTETPNKLQCVVDPLPKQGKLLGKKAMGLGEGIDFVLRNGVALASEIKQQNKLNYKAAGVDVEAGDALVEWLQATTGSKGGLGTTPFEKNIVSGIGGFASLFRMDFSKYKRPCLITCTDGVGTKVKLAAEFKNFSGIGQDLVAMCVNDLICTGGQPLMFLDYYAVGQLNLENAKAFLESVRRACFESECALVGGETAEMPGVYQPGDFDCAGFAVGIVDEEETLGAHRVETGDVLLGVSSSGFHSNGYSLLRKVFQSDLVQYQQQLLVPTALYVRLARRLRERVNLHAIAHITGGGVENLPRVLPDGVKVHLAPWKFPELFKLVQERTQMTSIEMIKTLNCGIGLVLVVPKSAVDLASQIIIEEGFQVFQMGQVDNNSNSKTEIYWQDQWVANK